MKTSALLVAAGRSRRYGEDKLSRPLRGSTVIQQAVTMFATHPRIQQVVLVVPPSRVAYYRRLCPACTVVAGGPTRTQSVRLGLAAVRYPRVLVHDAARPNVSATLVSRVVRALAQHDAVVPVVPVTDSLVYEGRYVDRAAYRAVQTPQGFRTELLRRCFEQSGDDYTDEGSLVSRFVPVCYIAGEVANRKLTHPVDMVGLQGEVRQGIGYDIHRLAEGRALVLGGVPIPYQRGLEGHSDADAALHALMDAMLSAVGEKDIGHFFPVDDDRYKGADSALLLGSVKAVLSQKGVHVTHVSIAIVAERPHLSPYMETMRRRIGDLLDLPETAVGITVTTNEGVPFAPFVRPDEDAIAAIAVVTVG